MSAQRIQTLAALGVASAALVACGGVTPDDHYESAEKLRSALNTEGYRCTELRTISTLEGYGEELRCEEGHTVAVWEEDLPDYVDDPVILFSIGGGLTGNEYLVSETWALISENPGLLDDIQKTFGGNRTSPNTELMELLKDY